MLLWRGLYAEPCSFGGAPPALRNAMGYLRRAFWSDFSVGLCSGISSRLVSNAGMRVAPSWITVSAQNVCKGEGVVQGKNRVGFRSVGGLENQGDQGERLGARTSIGGEIGPPSADTICSDVARPGCPSNQRQSLLGGERCEMCCCYDRFTAV